MSVDIASQNVEFDIALSKFVASFNSEVKVLVIFLCSFTEDKSSMVFYLRLTAVILLATMILTTVVFNVPVNIQTGKWAEEYNEKWERKRKIWRFFQGYRSIILIVAFILLIIAQTAY